MEIVTKFNVGDKVYFMYDNGIYGGTVRSIKASIFPQDIELSPKHEDYEVNFGRGGQNLCLDFNVRELFETPDDVACGLLVEYQERTK